MAELVERPRPFSLGVGVFFLVIGVAGVVASVAPDIRISAVAALSLLLGGAASLFALATRRAPAPEVDQD